MKLNKEQPSQQTIEQKRKSKNNWVKTQIKKQLSK